MSCCEGSEEKLCIGSSCMSLEGFATPNLASLFFFFIATYVGSCLEELHKVWVMCN